MKITTRRAMPQPCLLAIAIALGMGGSGLAHAITFNIGEVEGQLDSQISVGASWAMRAPDRDFISVANGGKASSRTSDDGRLNFKKGETFSKIFKGIHDLELKYGDSGIFLRGKYWYDFELKDEHRMMYDIDDHNRKEGAQSSGVQLLDAFFYHSYSVADLPGTFRVGKQVVSWGESTFIGNGINSINPTDVAAFRRPGSEVKEGLIPVNMLYLSQSVSDNLTAEAFYQLEWDQTVLDNCGTFFSTTDGVSDGCDENLAVLGTDFDRDAPNYLYVPRGGDRDARDSGQYGVALRWFVPELHDTEFGAYAMNYHSRTPSLVTDTASAPSPAIIPGGPTARYYVDYPEDIRLYGVSFQTTLESASVAGELSYRPNMPLSLNTADLLLATLGLQNQLYGSGVTEGAGVIPGSEIQGYVRKPVTQAQVSVTQFVDQVMGASRLTLVGEIGFNHIADIGEGRGDELRFGRDALYGPGEMSGAIAQLCPAFNTRAADCNDDGFFTQNSWGYRLRASLDYPNAIAGVSLSPNLAWSHDVHGYGPNFTEGAKAISVGVNAEYLNTYTASVSYTDFFGGHYNPITDRDFLAVSFGLNF